VFGESAGAGCIAALMAMPRASGLFHRAIAQSVPGLYFAPALATDIATAIAGGVGVQPSASELARLAPSRLNDAADEVARAMATTSRWGEAAYLRSPFAPVVDGDVLPALPWAALADGAASDVDLVVGHTRDEYRLFMVATGALGGITSEQSDEALTRLAPDAAAYRTAYPTADPERLYELVHSDAMFRMPSLRLAEVRRPSARSYVYELTWDAPGMGGAMLGACHGLGLPLTFGNLTEGVASFLIGDAPTPEASELSRRVRGAWTTFAATGRPGWPVFASPDRLTWIIDAEPTVQPYPEETSRHLWTTRTLAALDLTPTDAH
jgi:para-nitrobenzyl esterase